MKRFKNILVAVDLGGDVLALQRQAVVDDRQFGPDPPEVVDIRE